MVFKSFSLEEKETWSQSNTELCSVIMKSYFKNFQEFFCLTPVSRFHSSHSLVLIQQIKIIKEIHETHLSWILDAKPHSDPSILWWAAKVRSVRWSWSSGLDMLSCVLARWSRGCDVFLSTAQCYFPLLIHRIQSLPINTCHSLLCTLKSGKLGRAGRGIQEVLLWSKPRQP